MANNSVVVASWLMKPVRWNPVLPAQVAAASVVAAAVAATVVVVPAAAAVVTAVVVVVVAAVTAVVVAATKHLLFETGFGLTNKGPSGPFCFWRATQSLLRGLRGRPAKALSNRALGSRRSNLATTPICHGITR